MSQYLINYTLDFDGYPQTGQDLVCAESKLDARKKFRDYMKKVLPKWKKLVKVIVF